MKLITLVDDFPQKKLKVVFEQKLIEKGFKIHITSTKLNLLINLNNYLLSTELIIGYLNERLNLKNDIQNNAIIKKIQNSLPKISYLSAAGLLKASKI